MNVLVTGGAGYIGSHTAVELLNAGHKVVIVDDLSNAKVEVIDRIKEITGKSVSFYWMDCADKEKLWEVFHDNDIDAVIHFAGFKAVGESVKKPLQYYRNNLDTTLSLVEVMEEFGCRKLVFSSSATVYGPNNPHPYKEEMPAIQSTSPYGWTKVMIERILTDYCTAHPDFCAVLLRYFNPIGAHESGMLGEDPRGIPNNLMPYITQVAIGRREKLSVYGNDYDTPDGTGVRDYIHVVDLAKGHVAAVKYVQSHKGCEVFNLGTGTGYSVLDMVDAFVRANHVALPYAIVDRRPGDIAVCYADPAKSAQVLGWEAERTLTDMCRDAWNWQRKNPQGYES